MLLTVDGCVFGLEGNQSPSMNAGCTPSGCASDAAAVASLWFLRQIFWWRYASKISGSNYASTHHKRSASAAHMPSCQEAARNAATLAHSTPRSCASLRHIALGNARNRIVPAIYGPQRQTHLCRCTGGRASGGGARVNLQGAPSATRQARGAHHLRLRPRASPGTAPAPLLISPSTFPCGRRSYGRDKMAV